MVSAGWRCEVLSLTVLRSICCGWFHQKTKVSRIFQMGYAPQLFCRYWKFHFDSSRCLIACFAVHVLISLIT